MSNTVGTVLMALVVPIGWGLLSAWLFDRWRAWRQQGRKGPEAHGDDSSPEVAR